LQTQRLIWEDHFLTIPSCATGITRQALLRSFQLKDEDKIGHVYKSLNRQMKHSGRKSNGGGKRQWTIGQDRSFCSRHRKSWIFILLKQDKTNCESDSFIHIPSKFTRALIVVRPWGSSKKKNPGTIWSLSLSHQRRSRLPGKKTSWPSSMLDNRRTPWHGQGLLKRDSWSRSNATRHALAARSVHPNERSFESGRSREWSLVVDHEDWNPQQLAIKMWEFHNDFLHDAVVLLTPRKAHLLACHFRMVVASRILPSAFKLT
jgi:hypothetical protein